LEKIPLEHTEKRAESEAATDAVIETVRGLREDKLKPLREERRVLIFKEEDAQVLGERDLRKLELMNKIRILENQIFDSHRLIVGMNEKLVSLYETSADQENQPQGPQNDEVIEI